MKKEKTVLVFIPSLVAMLLREEELKGSALSKNEVLKIRDKSETMTVPLSVAKNMEEERGYTDIEAENCWIEWNDLRKELIDD
jgi:hypothetical protein